MKKKTVIFLSLLSVVLSLLYITLVYFGFLRYCNMYMASPETFIKAYSSLDKADKGRVVISLTTTPDQLKKLKPVLLSLLDQTVRVDEIAISVPYGKDYDIPEYVKEIAQVYRYSIKYGENGKLIPVILREGGADTKIILIDDDKVYGKDFIESITEESNKNPKKTICVKKLGSGYGTLIKPSFFDEKISDYDGKSSCGIWLKKCLKSPVKIIEYNETYKTFY